MNKAIKYSILLILIFLFFTMPITVPYFKSSTAYSMFNTGWNGISRFARLIHDEGKTVVPLLNPLDTYSVNAGTLMVVGPNTTFTGGELKTIRNFVRDGNTLFIADDFGTGNQILRALNVPVGISKYPLHDFFYRKDDRFIIVVTIKNPFLARNVSRIVTDEPSAIIVTRKGSIYASKVAMVNFHRRQFPLMTEVPYGKGRIIVLADPDILTNNLFGENEAFLRNLAEYLPGPVYVDEAHHPDFNLYTAGTITIKRVLPREKAIKITILFGLLIVLNEFGALRWLWKLLLSPIRRITMRKTSLEERALLLAREKGWDEKEVLELIDKLEGG